MATITAAQTGNWSDTATWTGGVVPTGADTARPSTFTVTIDQDITVTLLEALSTGHFSVTVARTINANVTSSTGHSGGGVVRCTHTTGTVTINGNVLAGPSRGVDLTAAGDLTIVGTVTGGSGSSAAGIAFTSTGTITSTGNVTGGSGTDAYGVWTTSTGVVNVIGNVAGGASGTSSHGINIASTTVDVQGDVAGGVGGDAVGISIFSGTLTVTGNITGSSTLNVDGITGTGTCTITVTGNATAGAGTSAMGVSFGSGSTCIITGRVTGGAGSLAYGAENIGSGTLRVGTAVGNDYGPLGTHSNSCAGLFGNNGASAVTTYKKLEFGAHGQPPVVGCAYLEFEVDGNTADLAITASTSSLLVDPADAADYPAEADVRNGTVYNNTTQTGTAYIPAANNVSYLVPVDATVGTGILTQADVTAAAWSTANMQAAADVALGRSVSNVDGTAATHSLYELIQAILESSTASGDWVIKKTDGTTTFNTRTLATDAGALPIVGVS